MIITYWILFVFFGFMAVATFRKYLFGKIYWFELLLMVLSVIIVAIIAGVLFGGLVIL